VAGRASGLEKTEWWNAGVVVPGSRRRLAYGSADATNPDWFYLSGASSPG